MTDHLTDVIKWRLDIGNQYMYYLAVPENNLNSFYSSLQFLSSSMKINVLPPQKKKESDELAYNDKYIKLHHFM